MFYAIVSSAVATAAPAVSVADLFLPSIPFYPGRGVTHSGADTLVSDASAEAIEETFCNQRQRRRRRGFPKLRRDAAFASGTAVASAIAFPVESFHNATFVDVEVESTQDALSGKYIATHRIFMSRRTHIRRGWQHLG